MLNFDPLTAEIGSGVWGTPANLNGFRVLAALLHGSQVVSVIQTLRRWTEGATYVRYGDHHVPGIGPHSACESNWDTENKISNEKHFPNNLSDIDSLRVTIYR